MKKLRRAAAAVSLAALLGCGGSSAPAGPPVEPARPAVVEIGAFARGLIESQSRDDNEPTPTEDRAFTDAEDANAFAASFFG